MLKKLGGPKGLKAAAKKCATSAPVWSGRCPPAAEIRSAASAAIGEAALPRVRRALMRQGDQLATPSRHRAQDAHWQSRELGRGGEPGYCRFELCNACSWFHGAPRELHTTPRAARGWQCHVALCDRIRSALAAPRAHAARAAALAIDPRAKVLLKPFSIDSTGKMNVSNSEGEHRISHVIIYFRAFLKLQPAPRPRPRRRSWRYFARNSSSSQRR